MTDRMIMSLNMKNLTRNTESRVLSQLICELQDVDTINAISARVDRAFHSFGSTQLGIVSHCEFIDTVARFIRHMYEHGLAVPSIMTHSAALSEGLDLLDRFYESGEIGGLEAAYLDVYDANGRGIDFVLRQLAETVKEREVHRYRNSLFHMAIDPTEAEEHMRIVKSLIENYGPMLPTSLTGENPWRFAKYYRDLIEVVVSTEHFVKQMRNSSANNFDA